MKRKVPCGGTLGPGSICDRCAEVDAQGKPGDACRRNVQRAVAADPLPKHQRAKPAYPEIIRGMLARGESREALKLAAGFATLGDQKAAITLGWSAVQRPEWYRSLGKDPAALEAAGVAALKERFGNG